MSQLIKIAGYPGEPRASVIFVQPPRRGLRRAGPNTGEQPSPGAFSRVAGEGRQNCGQAGTAAGGLMRNALSSGLSAFTLRASRIAAHLCTGLSSIDKSLPTKQGARASSPCAPAEPSRSRRRWQSMSRRSPTCAQAGSQALRKELQAHRRLPGRRRRPRPPSRCGLCARLSSKLPQAFADQARDANQRPPRFHASCSTARKRFALRPARRD